MSGPITHAEIKFIVDRPWASCSVTDWILVGNYIAQNRERDEKDAERAQTLEEFRQKFIARSENLQRYGDETMEKDRETLADWAFDNIPQLEPKPDKFDRLVATLKSVNRETDKRLRLCLFAIGDVGVMEGDVHGENFTVPVHGMSPEAMIAHLEKTKPVTSDRAKEIVSELFHAAFREPVADLLEELKQFVEQKEGGSDE